MAAEMSSGPQNEGRKQTCAPMIQLLGAPKS